MSLHRIKTAKQNKEKKIKQNKTTKETALRSSQRGTNIQYKSILFKKRVQMKPQQNRVINAFEKFR